MAMTIRETPVLQGKHAASFLNSVEANQKMAAAQAPKFQRAKKLYERMQKRSGLSL
jgi:hypothetical protein